MSPVRRLLPLLILLTLPACPDATTGKDTSASSPARSGEEIYRAERCGRCHALAGEGGTLGGALDGVGTKRDRPWLREYLRDPKSKVENAGMPPVELPDPELEAIIDYLEALK